MLQNPAHSEDVLSPSPAQLDALESRVNELGANIPMRSISLRAVGDDAARTQVAGADHTDVLPKLLYDIRARTNDPDSHGGSAVISGQATDVQMCEATKKRMWRKELLHMGALCWMMFLQGWNDGTAGPMLPRIQEVYEVS